MTVNDIDPEKVDANTNSSWNTNRITSVAAIFISVLSMFAVIYQSFLAREENDLIRIQQSASVLPYLSYWNSNLDGKFKFVIANKGVGPAFIKEVEFYGIDAAAKDTQTFNSGHSFLDFLEEQSTLMQNTHVIRYSFRKNMLISKNEELPIYTFPFNNDEEEKAIKDEFFKYYEGFKIVYEDVYGAAWVLESKTNAPIKLE